MPAKDEQFANTDVPPNVGGVSAVIDIRVSPVQDLNALSPIVVIVDGNLILSIVLHPLKAEVPMLVSDDGKFTLTREEYPLNT